MISFERYKDEIESIGVGKIHLIRSWLDEMNIKKYTINDDHTINVNGDVDLRNKKIISFPKYIQFNKIRGSFDCSYNFLKTLKGTPYEVNINFYCDNNRLSSLEFGPEIVNGGYFCNNNKLVMLKGIPKKINTLSCCYNELETLDGIPSDIEENLYCYENLLDSLDSLPDYVKGSLQINFKTANIGVHDIRNRCHVGGMITIK